MALERERAFLAAVLESLSDGIVACDAEGRLTLFNRATRALHSQPADRALLVNEWAARYGLRRADGVTPLLAEEVPLWRTFRGEEVRDAEIVIACAGRPAHTIRANGRQIRGADGELLGAVVAMRDVTEQVRAQTALEQERAFLQTVLDSLSENVSVCTSDGRLALFNRATLETHNLPADASLPPERWGDHYRVFQPDGETPFATDALPHVRVLATGQDALGVEFVVKVPGRGARTLVANAHALRDAAGAVRGSVCAARDMTAEKAAERRLRESESRARLNEARFRTALDAMVDAFYILHAVHGEAGAVEDFEIVEANAAGAAFAGTALDDLVGIRLGELTPLARASGLLDMYRRVLETGERYDGEYQTRDPRFGGASFRLQVVRTSEGLAVTSRDITEKKRAEATLQELAVRDELTGLLNRRGFRQLAEQEVKVARREGRRDAVLALDLNGFKPINDTYGHAAGDAALRWVAEVLRATLRETDVIGRVGGDEFMVYAPMLQGAHEPGAIVARLQAEVARANAAATTGGRAFAIHAAIGVAEAEGSDDLDALLARADAALYAAKRPQASARAA